MDCDGARQLLAFAHPAEMEPADLALLDEHIATCPDCGPLAQATRQADDSIGRAMRAVPVPDGLRTRLTTHLTAARGAWWRHSVLRAGTVGVGVILAAGALYALTRPGLDLTAEAARVNAESGLWKPDDQGRDDANERLRALGAPPAAPEDFDYHQLKLVERSDSHGVRSAPTLLFTRGDAYAKVVLVREGDVKNLGELDGKTGEDSGCWVTVRRVPDRRGWFYIITTYNKPLQFFQRKSAAVPPA
jgi:hypothetical protein